MNLRKIANASIQAINKDVSITAKVSDGTYTTEPDGTRIPNYTTIITTGNMQPLSTQDLKRLEGLNIQNVTAKVFLNGNFEGVFRNTQRGGDLLIIGGNTYLVTAVIERWPSWCLVGVTMQMT